MRILILATHILLSADFPSADPIRYLARPASPDTCFNGKALGIQEMPLITLPGYQRVYLVRCDCECTMGENDLQVVGVKGREARFLSEYVGDGIGTVEGRGTSKAAFVVLRHEGSGEEATSSEDTVYIKGDALIGADGLPDPKPQIDPAKLPIPGPSAGGRLKPVDFNSIWADASKFYRSGKKAEAAETICAKIGEGPYPATKADLAKLNDLGFYLVEGGRFEKGASVLKSVLAADSSRVVAYLNLGDALDGMGKKDSATTVLREYVRRMEASGRGNKVPARIKSRLAPSNR